MSASLDHRWSMVPEGTYNTPVTTTRFYPMLDDSDFDWDPRPRQSVAQQGGNGRRADLGSRRYLPIGRGTIKLKAELESRGGGVLLNWALGASTVTAITGGSQQVFHLGIAGTLLTSATIQAVKVQNTGTEAVETFAGCTPSKVTIEQPEDDLATIMVEADARSLSTVTAAATTVYPTGPTIFDHWQGAVGLGSTLVAPTTTALASGLTAFTDFRSWKLEIDQGIDIGRWVIGSRNQPLAGKPVIKFSGKVEYNSSTLSAALVAGTKLPFYQTWTAPEAGAPGGNAQLQVVVPQLSITKGLAQTKAGATTVQDIEADVTNDGSNRDVYVVVRTADTVL